MARILFGVMGDASGHVSRALSVAQELPGHEFLFLGGGKVLGLKTMGYAVEGVPMTSTYYRRNRVDVAATVQNALKILLGWRRTTNRVERIMRDFDPDLVLTDYEFFSPLAARRMGIHCISVDHQHFLSKCACSIPKEQALGRFMLALPLRYMYSKAEYYLITSFFQLPVADPTDSEMFPPILRSEVREMTPSQGSHVLVYQTSPTFLRLLPVLEQLRYPCIVYGFGERPSSSRVVFKAPSRRGFLEDLASCQYAVTNGGHNVISEALFYGKPVFSFPIRLAYEQFFNAHMLRILGFGDYSIDPYPDLSLFDAFERRLEVFRVRIGEGDFYGNDKLAARLEEIILTRKGR